jgi:hypothetical protein
MYWSQHHASAPAEAPKIKACSRIAIVMLLASIFGTESGLLMVSVLLQWLQVSLSLHCGPTCHRTECRLDIMSVCTLQVLS